jgi:hypothetical protein
MLFSVFQERHLGHPAPCNNMSLEKAKKAFEENKVKDEIKNKYCKDNNVRLLRIPYWEKQNIEKIILDFIHEVQQDIL